MSTPDGSTSAFVSDWTAEGGELAKFPARALAGLPLDSRTRTFLTEVGLPKTAAPFLTFGWPDEGTLRTVLSDLAVSEDEIEDDEDRALVKELWVIGADGGGDKIAVTNDGRVLVFDHSMVGTLPMNASLPRLGASLVAYRAYAKGGRAEELVAKGDVEKAKAQLRSVVNELRGIDAASYDAGGYWQRQLGFVLLRVGQDPSKRALGLELAEILSPPR